MWKRRAINVLVRFSLKNVRSQYGRDVFAPDYLEYRLGIFKNITLKSFQSQTDKNFNTFMLMSYEMPDKYKILMEQIARENPFIRNVWTDSKNISVPKELLPRGLMISARLDSDDGMPRDFIARLRPFLDKKFLGFALSIPQFSKIAKISGGEFLIQPSDCVSNSMGLAYVCRGRDGRSIMDCGGHLDVRFGRNMILLAGTGGLMTINGANNRSQMNPKLDLIRTDSAGVAEFLFKRNYPGFDFDCLREI